MYITAFSYFLYTSITFTFISYNLIIIIETLNIHSVEKCLDENL